MAMQIGWIDLVREDGTKAILQHSLYATIFVSMHGKVPAGILGLVSLGVGLSVHEAKGKV